MKIKVLGETDSVHFNGTISGINETVTPEWNTYKYIGSPFKVYTYGGVERSLSFDFKLYCTSRKEKDIMLQKLNYLTSLAYPYKQLSNVRYNETATQQTMFAPNFIFLTIKSLFDTILLVILKKCSGHLQVSFENFHFLLFFQCFTLLWTISA